MHHARKVTVMDQLSEDYLSRLASEHTPPSELCPQQGVQCARPGVTAESSPGVPRRIAACPERAAGVGVAYS